MTENYRDGLWHAVPTFSPRPLKVHTLKGVQHHVGAHALVQRWNGSKVEYEHCGCIHKKRSTTFKCAERLARILNKYEEGRL